MGLAPYNGTHPLGNINQFHVIIDTPKIPDLARHEQAFVSTFSEWNIIIKVNIRVHLWYGLGSKHIFVL